MAVIVAAAGKFPFGDAETVEEPAMEDISSTYDETADVPFIVDDSCK